MKIYPLLFYVYVILPQATMGHPLFFTAGPSPWMNDWFLLCGRKKNKKIILVNQTVGSAIFSNGYNKESRDSQRVQQLGTRLALCPHGNSPRAGRCFYFGTPLSFQLLLLFMNTAKSLWHYECIIILQGRQETTRILGWQAGPIGASSFESWITVVATRARLTWL